MISHEWKENDAPLLIVMGQSNAHGHGTRLSPVESELVCTHVYGLNRQQNQSFQCQDVIWEPFAMHGMNLGETQDYTCCLGSEFARLWEKRAKQEENLPFLYVIQISIGSQGIDSEEKDGLNMWWKERPQVLIPGELNAVDISLYPLAQHVLTLAIQNLKRQKKTPVILGLHWNQWETEVFSGGDVIERAQANYEALFQGFYEALGERCKTYLYSPISLVYENEPARKQINALFQTLENQNEQTKIIDVRKSPLYRSDRENQGVFQEDGVHYLASTQKWFAKVQFQEVFGRKILVLGDSITANGRYIDYLNQYFEQNRLDENVRFFNAGLCSETVSGLTENTHPGPRPCVFERIEQILEEDSQSVLICYGMNDGIYHPFCEERFRLYKEGIQRLVSRLEKEGKEVYLMTPPPFDSDSFGDELRTENEVDFSYLHPYERYDDVLAIYTQWLLTEYGEKGYTVILLREKMKTFIERSRMCNQDYLWGDGIHPNEDGHRLIMQVILETMFQATWTGIWEGFSIDCFTWKGYEVTVAKPKQEGKHRGWVYRTEFFGAFPAVDLEMLENGYHVANFKISNRYGDPVAVEWMEKFRQMIVKRYRLMEQPILFGFSRGGLYALHYAASYGEYVSKMYLDAPVIDLYSWPRNYKDGIFAEWQECKRCWKIGEDGAPYWKTMEQALGRLTQHRIPLILVYGDADDVVPYQENGLKVEEQYKKGDVPYQVIAKKGCAHHPHSLEDPTEIVKFLRKDR